MAKNINNNSKMIKTEEKNKRKRKIVSIFFFGKQERL